MSFARLPLRILEPVVLCVALGACAPSPDADDRTNVVLVVVDTLRADKLGCYGNARGLSPNIDRWARGGLRFEHAFSHAPWTLPSFASMFTSLYPQQHGAGGNVRDGGFHALAPEAETFTERLQRAGYATHAIVNVEFLGTQFGVAQGFDDVDARFSDDNRTQRDARETTAQALRWIDAAKGRPFFLFVHYFDPHAAYEPPQPYRRRFARPEDAEAADAGFGTRLQVVAHRAGKLPLAADVLQRAEALYDGEVAFTDEHVGALFDGLAARGLSERTLVVLTSDHGEEFGDHGSWEHGHTHYDELLRVPLILAQPGRIAPGVATRPAAHVDLAPTICARTGVGNGAAFRGTDLSAGAPQPLQVAYGNFWGPPISSLRTADWKLVSAQRDDGDRSTELYRWRTDPREREDLAAQPGSAALELGRVLGALEHELAASGFRAGPRLDLSPEVRDRLKGLGYVSGDDE